MNPQTSADIGGQRRRKHPARDLLLALALVALLAPPALPAMTQVAAAAGTSTLTLSPPPGTLAQTSNTLTLRVESARDEPRHPDGPVLKGDPVTTYRFLINVDNTGDPSHPRSPDCDPNYAAYPANCPWPSIRTQQGYAPIFTQGDQTILDDELMGIDLPPGKYLISVLADGYKIGGAHFTVPLPDPGLVTVQVQPYPLPAATMQIKVFDDRATNGQFDTPLDRGLAGFRAIVGDIVGQVTADLFGNPICTEYQRDVNGDIIFDLDGNPIPIPGTGGECISDADGIIKIPNLAPNRYDVSMAPPQGTNWVQTTTLEGGKGWDTWLQENSTGLDNEFMVAGEPFPWTVFGFVQPKNELTDTNVTGGIQGTIVAASVYVPLNGGLPYYGGQWGGLAGAEITGPIDHPWLALNDLLHGDTAVWVGQGNADGSFYIPHVPDGDYSLSYWDGPQQYILDLIQVSVVNGQVSDVGTPMLTGWYTRIEGYVFHDENENGKLDGSEDGLPDYLIAVKRRENSSIDRGIISTMTDSGGYYMLESLYPLTQWVVIEAYSDRHQTVGITWQAQNQPQPTTVLGSGVDVGVLPIIGHTGRLDWGVKPYKAETNGGIAGTVSYDSLRNELDARYAAVDPWQPGIPGLTMKVYATVTDGDGKLITETTPGPNFGAYVKGHLLNTTVTEQFVRPKDCQARDVDGNPVDQLVLPPATGGYDCLEGPLMGVQFQTGFTEVDGNFGFSEIITDTDTGDPLPFPLPIPPGDYLVEVVVPNDSFGRPLYQVTREEDVNVFGGAQYFPAVPPSACAGPLHVVDVAGVDPDGPNAVDNPSFADVGGSPYENMEMPLCNVKLVTVSAERSIAPAFTLFTEVPIPGRWMGYIIDDLTLSTNKEELFFGEKAGIPNVPVGIYDFTNQLLLTVQSDPNGVYEVLMPSSVTDNVPSPTGFSPSVYYQVGNDPGQPGQLNANYNPQYRTIGTSFEIYPGDIIPSDLAPTQIGVSIQWPGSQPYHPAPCKLGSTTPELFAVSRPYSYSNSTYDLTIAGQHFGATPGTVTLQGACGTVTTLAIVSWADGEITATVPAGLKPGPYQLLVTAASGEPVVNGLTFHVLGLGYDPVLFEAGQGKTYTTVQEAIDAAAAEPLPALVVVYPGTPALWNPDGAYFENPVIYEPVKLQGVGPGGVRDVDSSHVPGSVLDGRLMTGDTGYSGQWRTFVETLVWDGNPIYSEGQVIYVLAKQGDFGSAYKAAVDGFTIQGGDQQGFPNRTAGQQPFVEVQGGAFYVNAYARYLQITNNVIRSNGGAYGAIRLGTPNWGDNHNENIRIANNRILANGGTNLAGAIALFEGSGSYEVAYNHLCGNFSAEYGGAISHYGYSPNGKIHHNRIEFNRSYDEGGGIMIAGELPASPAVLSPGAGAVSIYNNIIQSNLGNDDGGGLRFLMAGNFPFNVYNNFIANNISTHEGGGISLNDAPNVRIYNNTIMKNLTTATALTSNGEPAPAGLSTSRNSAMLQATLPPGAPPFSKPLLFNNIFWDNRAGRWTGGSVDGIGLTGDLLNPINLWDMGVAGTTYLLEPTYSMLNVTDGTVADPSNQVGVDPMVVQPYDTTVSILPWRGNLNLVGVDIVAVDSFPTTRGDYHLQVTSPAINAGAGSKAGIFAPRIDLDRDPRPSAGGFEIGGDETGPLSNYAVVLPGSALGAVRLADSCQFLPLVLKRF
ncbi:MAG: hypothetical protein CEE40_05545 [Chloroflexi bacterium B3_Chlor]|nr:MAG: hypothetical protein CEE40_05545 [Chloroflexi bacterium B3_Chlor]